MPQEFQVLQCYNCNMFQVEIVKKKQKWECKICHEKQSVKQVFLRGTSRDCRLLVQDCNEKRLSLDETPKFNNAIFVPSHGNFVEKCTNKWSEFIPTEIDSQISENEQVTTGDYTIERPAKRRKIIDTSDDLMETECIECGTSNDHVMSVLQYTTDGDRHSPGNSSYPFTNSFAVSTSVEPQRKVEEADKSQENSYNEYQSARKEYDTYQSNANMTFQNESGARQDTPRRGCSTMPQLLFEDDSSDFSDEFLF